MSHFAELDDNNIVIRVLVGDNNDPAGDEGYSWFVNNLGGRWVQTSYSGRIRKNYAGIGYTYDPVNDWFHAPQPYPSWTLDADAKWQPPVAYPTDGVMYQWDETITDWKAIVND